MVSLQVVPLKNDDLCVGVPTVKKVLFPLFLILRYTPFSFIFLQNNFVLYGSIIILSSSSEVGTSIKQANRYNINV